MCTLILLRGLIFPCHQIVTGKVLNILEFSRKRHPVHMDIQRREKYTHLRHLSIQIALLDRRPDQYHASVSRRQDQVWICRGTPLGIPEKVDNQQTERRQYAIDRSEERRA